MRLTDWGVIRAARRRRRSFLHGQLTQRRAAPGPGARAPGRLLLGQGPAAGQLRDVARAAPTRCCWPAAPTCCPPR
ncbi:MAG: hypothetical protein MZW92_30385 [Comamonadaceae bacterium]|nr:hypothetical protein [Comamonadaceae bacterium]